MEPITFLYQLGAGAVAGMAYSFTGYAKQKDEPFDLVKFLKTAAIGAVVGMGAYLLNLDMLTVEAMVGTIGLTAVIENGLKALVRHLFSK